MQQYLHLPTAFIIVSDFKFSNELFLLVAMLLLWCFCLISSKIGVLWSNTFLVRLQIRNVQLCWNRTPSHFFLVNFLNNWNRKSWNCFKIFHYWYTENSWVIYSFQFLSRLLISISKMFFKNHSVSFCSVGKFKLSGQNHTQLAKSGKTRFSGQSLTYRKKLIVVSKLDSVGKILPV